MLTSETFSYSLSHIVEIEPEIERVYQQYGAPPFWHYEPGFSALLRIILGQQVSVASAAAAYRKLEARIGDVSPQRVLELTEEELRACYFSRQKMRYARNLATAVLEGDINLEALHRQPDEVIRAGLKQIKGIGDWTVDIYLLLALHRPDIFPAGDLAARKVLKELGLVPPPGGREELLLYVERFRPHRSVLTLLLWHKYIQDRGIKFA